VEEDERDVPLVAVHDEAGGLVCGIVVDHAGHVGRFARAGLAAGEGALGELALIGDDADGVAADVGVGAAEALAIVGLVFVEIWFERFVAVGIGCCSAVDDAGEDVADVILLAGLGIEE